MSSADPGHEKKIGYLAQVGGSKQWQQLNNVHTTDDLWNNFRETIYYLNQDKLNNLLSESEFLQVKEQILNQTKTPYQAGVFLYGVGGKSQVEIDRDDGKHVYLTIFDQDQIGAGKTTYQVVKQIERSNVIEGKKNRRFDVTLLINGLPIIQIEEKADGHDAKEALNQMHQYIGENQYSGIFSTIQILIAMTPHDVRYMSNAGEDFNTDFAFQCKKNQSKKLPISDWKEFVNEFLSIPMAHKMATNYMILDNTKNHQSIKAMRYYQVFATQKIIEQVRNYDFEGVSDNRLGYVWHTTGSGKTISSFKTAFLASRLPNVDKVVFLVDRVALTNQTTEKYQAYDPNADENNNGGVVLDTANVSDLKRKIKSKSNKDIIVTSIQKLDKLVSDHKFSVNDKKILFIVDEAHRSTGGKMLQEIKQAFKKSAWIGYTGTPNFDSDNGPTTAEVFGKPLHRYVISDAISDHNVLGFQVDFQTTLSMDELKEKYLPNYYATKNPKWTDDQIKAKIDHLNPEEMDEEVNSSVYDMQSDHVKEVVHDILKYWDTRSVKRKYNALMTTKVGGMKPSIPMALMYYDEFKKQMKDMENPLKIGITFSYDTSNGYNQKENNEGLERVMQDYNQRFKTNFDATTVKEYTNDLVSRLDKSASDKNYLDLVIVVDQLLTGFDAPQLNTLYVDRILRGANLIQAYSRTNRIHNMQSKPFGHIVNYRWPHYSEKLMNHALSRYADFSSADLNEELLEEEPDSSLLVKYENIRSELNEIIPELSEKTDGFMQIPPSDRDKEAVYPKLNRFNHLIAQAKQCDEYQDMGAEKFLNQIGMDEDQEARLTGPIANELKTFIAQKRKMDPIDLDLKMEHIKEVEVNYDYLNDLIAEYANHVKNNDLATNQLDQIKAQIYQQLDVISDKDPKYVGQIKSFIESDIKSHIQEQDITGNQIEKIISDFGKIDSLDKIDEFIKYWGLKTKDKKAYFENRKQFSKFYKINSNYFYSNFKGIPQGTSISSILANVYMINFDDEMNNLANEYSGIFRRYSDDFIMILPSLNISQKNAKIIKKTIIKKSNKILSLNIESDKTDFFIFKNKRFFNSNNKLKELNYLGFRFTGTKIFLREKSIYKYVYKSNKGIKFLIRDFNDKKRAKLWSTKKIEYYKFKKPIFNKKNIVIRWNNLSNYYNNLRINQVKFVKNKLENKSKFNISKRNKENYLYGNFSKSNFLNYAKRAQNILEKENPSYTVMVLKQVRRRVDKNQRIYHRGISRNSEYI